MKKVFKRILITSLFLVVFFGLYFYMGMVIIPKDENDLGGVKYYLSLGYKAEPKDTLDFAVFGNSSVYSGHDPIQFYKATGIASYSVGTGKQTLQCTKKTIDQMISWHKDLKVVILETNCFLDQDTIFQGSVLNEMAPLIAPFRYHARWKEIEAKDFYTIPSPKPDKNKGFFTSYDVCPIDCYNPDIFMKDTSAKAQKLQSSVIRGVKKIKKKCDKEGIKLVLWSYPVPYVWNNSLHNAIEDLAKKLDIDYVDLNLPGQTPEDFDFYTSFKDNGVHLNANGARSCTSYMVKYMKDNFDLPDHRGQEAYKSWDELADAH